MEEDYSATKPMRKELHALELYRMDAEESSIKVSVEMERAKGTIGRLMSARDLLDAEMAIIGYSQRKKFKEEVASLSAGKSVSRDSSIYKLDPCLEDGLLRVGGRLSRAALPEENKHPPILSKDQHISTLILRHFDQQVGHGGRNRTLSKQRSKFWISNSNAADRKIISQWAV